MTSERIAGRGSTAQTKKVRAKKVARGAVAAQAGGIGHVGAAQGALVAEGMGRYEPGLGPVHLPRGEGLAWAALRATATTRRPSGRKRGCW